LYDFYSYWRKFTGNFTTLPQYFKNNGYHTYSIGKVFHPGESSNFTDDYPDSWSERPFHPPSDEFINTAVCRNEMDEKPKKNLICPVDVRTQPGGTLPDIESMLHAKEFLASATEPYFLAVGFHKPHIPLRFPRQYLQYHDIDRFSTPDIDFRPYNIPDVAWNPFTDVRERDDIHALNISFPDGIIPKRQRMLIRQSYYAAVTYVDDLIGELMKSVDLTNTVVVLTSDHGWSLGEHSEWAKYSNFDVAVRVPLIVWDPSSRTQKQQKLDNVVELVDLFPTLVDLCGLPRIPECKTSGELTCTEGKSLYPLLKGSNNDAEGVAFSQYPRPAALSQKDSDRPRLKKIKIMGYSMRTARFRYTCWIGFNRKTFVRNWNRLFGEELYDHSIDEDEYLNLADRAAMNSIKQILKTILQTMFP
jgi:iduronate 2-sulfatase